MPVFGSQRSRPKSAMLRWEMMSPNVSNSRNKRTNSASNCPSKQADGSVVELADALDWPITRVNSLGKFASGDNDSVRRTSSTVAAKSIRASSEKPRSLV